MQKNSNADSLILPPFFICSVTDVMSCFISATCPLCRQEIVRDNLHEDVSCDSDDGNTSHSPSHNECNPSCSYSENMANNADGSPVKLDASENLDGSFVNLTGEDYSDGWFYLCTLLSTACKTTSGFKDVNNSAP